MILNKIFKAKIKPEQDALPGLDVPKKIEKKKVKQSKKNGRWAIIIFFLLTVLASLIFYLKAELPLIWEKITSPAVISTFPED